MPEGVAVYVHPCYGSCMTTKTRISYRKMDSASDYVDARFEVLLDGERIGEVTRNSESRGASPGGLRYYTRTWVATVWNFEASGYRSYLDSKTRVDAVIDYLTSARGMSLSEAREAAGKRGW